MTMLAGLSGEVINSNMWTSHTYVACCHVVVLLLGGPGLLSSVLACCCLPHHVLQVIAA
jgi:hypothetical protein